MTIKNNEERAECYLLHTDEEILREVKKASPRLICIDAPLSLPPEGKWYRDCDLQARRLGFRVLSPRLPGMLMLTKRAIKLASVFRRLGFKVIEVFPRATERVLGLKKEKRVNKDKYDALLCALTGKYYLLGKYELIGDEKEGIVIPSV